jgi:hypothetical protein
VLWIEEIRPFELRNDGSRALIHVNEVQAAPYNLSGNGLNLGMWDKGSVFAHDAFAGRLVIKESGSISEHATHVAGTMAGNGANSLNNYLHGMAPHANVYSWKYGTTDEGGWTETYNEMVSGVDDDDIILSQNSWGENTRVDDEGKYKFGSHIMDKLVREKNIPVIFAVGYGTTATKPYGTLWIPETGKNIIAVTATTKTGGPYPNNRASKGPCLDGRLKPDIAAAGVDIVSTWIDNGYYTDTGTSMAAPAISGTLALLIERFKQQNNNALPDASLIKAILLNTATDIGNWGPDYKYGYGLANALNAVKLIDGHNHLMSSISQGGTNTHSLAVPSGITELRVMLTYTDPEALPNAIPAWINNLDITLIAPNTFEYLPLTLDPSNPSAIAEFAVNNRDNVEQVAVGEYWTGEPVQAGNWTIKITAPSVPMGPQQYAITWFMDGTVSVTVDQKLNDNTTRVGTIGHWIGLSFEPRFAPPKDFTFSLGTIETFHGDVNVYSNEKYNKWNDFPNG